MVLLCKPVRANDRFWRNAVELAAFVHQHGHCRVPDARPWMPLRRFVDRARALHAEQRMEQEKVDVLENLQFDFGLEVRMRRRSGVWQRLCGACSAGWPRAGWPRATRAAPSDRLERAHMHTGQGSTCAQEEAVTQEWEAHFDALLDWLMSASGAAAAARPSGTAEHWRLMDWVASGSTRALRLAAWVTLQRELMQRGRLSEAAATRLQVCAARTPMRRHWCARG
jgi:Helicase associated domain